MSGDPEQKFPVYSIPDGVRVYAIGDVHGYLSPLQEMHQKIEKHLSENPVEQAVVVYLGDYVDRGPNSADVIEYLCSLQQKEAGLERYFIKGNHEWGMLGFMNHPLSFGRAYLMWGGLECLESYGVDIPEHVTQDAIVDGVILPAEYERLAQVFQEHFPVHHKEFLEGLMLYKQVGDYLFVHAGVKPGVALEDQSPQDMMRIRGEFSECPYPYGFRVVHGHQITKDVEVKPNRIGVDTGFYEQGILSCAVLEGEQVDILQVKQVIEEAWVYPKDR